MVDPSAFGVAPVNPRLVRPVTSPASTTAAHHTVIKNAHKKFETAWRHVRVELIQRPVRTV